MIIRLFNHSSGAASAINYVLSDRDYTGKNRSIKPLILDGSAEITKHIDLVQCSDFRHKNTSGVISFADNEEITDKQKFKLIDDFKKSFFGNCSDKVNALFVEHQDKGNLEIHFIINRSVVTENGIRAFNPFPPGRMTQDFKDCFCALKNNEYGFKQITENPLKTKFSSNEKIARQLDKNSFINLDEKDRLDNAIKDIVNNGLVKNKMELVEYLKKEIGLNIHRNGDDYISIKTHSGKNIRLKGGIYSNHDNKDYDNVKKEFKQEFTNEFNQEKILEKFNRIIEARNNYNEKRYLVKATSKTPSFKPIESSRAVSGSKPVLSAPTENKQPGGSPGQSITDIQQPKSQEGRDSSQGSKPRDNSHTGFSGSSAGNGATAAQDSVNKAMGALSSARTPEEMARARVQLAIAIANLNRILASAEETRRRQLNRRKI